MQSMANVMTMMLGSYDARHINQWSILVAPCGAPKRHYQASARAVLARRILWPSLSSYHKNTTAQLYFS
jgi:hypothetical protein